MDTQMLIRIIVGVLMIAVVGVFAAKRVLWLTKLIRSGPAAERGQQPQRPPAEAHHHAVRRSLRANPAAEAGRSPASPTSSRCGASSSSARFTWRRSAFWSSTNFHIPLVGRWDALGFLQDFFAVAVLLGIITFAIIRIVARAQEARPRLPVLRLPHRRRLADPVHDLQRHLDLRPGPRCRRQHRARCPTATARSSRSSWAGSCIRSATPPTSGSRRSRCSRTSRSCWSSC